MVRSNSGPLLGSRPFADVPLAGEEALRGFRQEAAERQRRERSAIAAATADELEAKISTLPSAEANLRTLDAARKEVDARFDRLARDQLLVMSSEASSLPAVAAAGDLRGSPASTEGVHKSPTVVRALASEAGAGSAHPEAVAAGGDLTSASEAVAAGGTSEDEIVERTPDGRYARVRLRLCLSSSPPPSSLSLSLLPSARARHVLARACESRRAIVRRCYTIPCLAAAMTAISRGN
jgi:hypothetical protein